MEYTVDPEQQAYIEYQLRALEESRAAPIIALAEWYCGLSDAERLEHEDFVRRCTAGGADALRAVRPASA